MSKYGPCAERNSACIRMLGVPLAMDTAKPKDAYTLPQPRLQGKPAPSSARPNCARFQNLPRLRLPHVQNPNWLIFQQDACGHWIAESP